MTTVARLSALPLRLTGAVSLRPLRRRNFTLLWAGGLVSNIGSWMQTVAVGALVTAATGRATWTVLVAAGAFLPIGFLSPIGGALADRLARRRWLIIGYVVETILAGVLAGLVYAGQTAPWLMTLIVTLQGCVGALVFPFQQAILPDLVPRDEFLAAASLGSAQYNMGRVVGPALAGIVVAQWGFGAAFAVNALSFLAVVIALAFMQLAPPPGTGTDGLWHTIRAGARATMEEPGCRAAIGLIAALALLASPFIALLPAVARSLTDGTSHHVASATAVLTTGQGIGAVLGALTVAPLAIRFGRGRLLIGEIVAVCFGLIAYAQAPTLAWATVTLTIVGAIYLGVLSGLSTVIQLRAPDVYRGRILSIYFVALGVLYPVGALLQGPIADVVGLPATTTAGALALLAVIAALALWRPRVLTVLGEERSAPAPVGGAPVSGVGEAGAGGR